jgi:type IV pilus assembly protein PilP
MFDIRIALTRCFLLIILSLSAGYIQAEVAKKTDQVYKPTMYIYQLDGRSDPFLPFLSQKKTGGPPEFIVELAKDRGKGWLRIEPGQLKLAAVIFAQGGWRAVAEDVSGQGYFLYEGMPLGNYGIVKKIENGRVIVEEVYQTSSGRLITKEIVMRLKKEGE